MSLNTKTPLRPKAGAAFLSGALVKSRARSEPVKPEARAWRDDGDHRNKRQRDPEDGKAELLYPRDIAWMHASDQGLAARRMVHALRMRQDRHRDLRCSDRLQLKLRSAASENEMTRRWAASATYNKRRPATRPLIPRQKGKKSVTKTAKISDRSDPARA
jgi:hypothetical protein